MLRLSPAALRSFTILIACAIAFPVSALDVPPNDGFVTDIAELLTEEQEHQLEQELTAYTKETSNEIAVLIVPSTQGEQGVAFAVEVGRAWKVGTEKDNGILILVAYEEREVTIATGYGLEGAAPDIVTRGIREQVMIPYFREGEYYEGIQAGIEALKKHIGGEYTADRYDEEEGDGFWPFLAFFGFFLFDVLASFLARSKSWWLGGILGGVFGLILTFVFSWWLAIPALVVLGLFFDFLVSRSGYGRNRRRGGGGWWSGGGGFGSGGRGGGGGFGGFSGGSFGGGGGSSRW
ncbi:MAG: TPM domain-containing protein [Candidatus Peregrinibacteria bacterium]|nr:TPM domain-containing protein [Candidatus Peregrinibacteria bacterium]